MSIFREFAELIYDAYNYMSSWEDEVEAYRKHEREATERRLSEEHRIAESLERKEREAYWNQYLDDPTSVMILPFGWSPFGIYL
jgi:hypothetical protein